MKKNVKIEISPKSILLVLLSLAAIWVIVKLHGVLILIFIAFSISAMLSPIIDYLNSKRIPKSISIAVIYITFILLCLLLILISYKPLITQLEEFVISFPDIFVNVASKIIDQLPFLKERFNWDDIFENLRGSFWENFKPENFSDYLLSGINKAFGIVGSVFGALINILSTLVLSIYFIQFKEPSKEKFVKLIPARYQKRIFKFINNVESQLGAWLRGQILLMIVIGVLAWIGLEAIGAEFSIPLGIVAGLLEIIPNIGPIITWAIAVMVAIGSDLEAWQVIFVAAWFIIIQQLENYLIVPKLMQKIVGTNPVLTIIAVLGASEIFGFWGAILAVPLVAIIQISFRYYLEYRRKK
jgi:predicted PurR-regulated permease PerM